MILNNIADDIMEKLSRGALNSILISEPLEVLKDEKKITFWNNDVNAPISVTCQISQVYDIEIFSDGTAFWPQNPNRLMVGNRECGPMFLDILSQALGYFNWTHFLNTNRPTLFPTLSGKLQQWDGCVIVFG